jgi:hypothetical protein
MSSTVKKTPGQNLRKLEYSPNENPLIQPQEIVIKRRYVSSGTRRDLADPDTGEIQAAAVIRVIEDKDDEEFVKVFSAGVAAAYQLNRTAQRVFQAVLDEYQRTPMKSGFAESVTLYWFDGGISGRTIGMSEKTFQRGLKDLLTNGFIYPKIPNIFWVNPSLFFKGSRVIFMREYRRKSKEAAEKDTRTLDIFETAT